MDIEIYANIEGLDELNEALTQGNKRASAKFLRKVEMDAAKILVASAKENAPYAEGDLSEDIHRQSIVSDGAVTVRVGPSRETFYGLFQEFGAPEANVPALHWLEESAKRVQSEVLEALTEGLQQGLADMKRS